MKADRFCYDHNFKNLTQDKDNNSEQYTKLHDHKTRDTKLNNSLNKQKLGTRSLMFHVPSYVQSGMCLPHPMS